MNTPTSIVKQHSQISAAMRWQLLQQKPHMFWFTGLSGAGKSTLAYALEKDLHIQGRFVYVLDGDNIRHGLCRDLGFSAAQRDENIRRIAEVGKLFVEAGAICLAAFISPFHSQRELVRSIVGAEYFSEIYIRCSLEECERRDVKGNYKKARAGKIPEYTGISSPYEEPVHPELILDTQHNDLGNCVHTAMAYVQNKIQLA